MPKGVAPRFQLTADTEAVPVVPAGQPAPTTANLVVDLSAFLTTFTGYRRVLATIADVERVVVTVTAANGQTFSQTLSRAAIASGLNSLSFTGLPAGGATVTVTAEDAAGQVLASSMSQATVISGRTADLAVVAPISAPTGSSGGSGASATPVPAATSAPAGMALGVTLSDPVTHTQLNASATTLDGLSGLGDVAFDAAGGAWVTSGTTQHHQPYPSFGMVGLFRLAAGTYANTFVSMPGDPYEIALDGAGAMWVTSLVNRTLTKLATTVTPVPNLVPTGTVTTLATCQLPAQPGPRALALDASGHAWVANGEHVTRVSPTGTLVDSYALGGPAGAITADPARGVIWATSGNRLVKLDVDGTVLMTTPPFTRSPHNDFAGLTVDAAGRVWLALPGDNAIARFDADGAALPRIELDWPVRDVAIDSQGQVWAAVGLVHAYSGVQVARLSPQGVLRQTFGKAYGIEAVYVAPDDTVWAKDSNGLITRIAP